MASTMGTCCPTWRPSPGTSFAEDGVALAHAVHRETDGNPFFLSEVLRHLAETGAIYQDEAGQWTTAESLGSLALPDSVREVVGGRVARLGDRAERSLVHCSGDWTEL